MPPTDGADPALRHVNLVLERELQQGLQRELIVALRRILGPRLFKYVFTTSFYKSY